MQYRTGNTHVLLALAVALASGCSEAAPDPAFERPQIQVAHQALTAADGTRAPQSKFPRLGNEAWRREIIDVWSLQNVGCAMERGAATPPDELMKNVPAAKRAEAIVSVLLNERLGSPQVKQLVALLRTIPDAKATEYLTSIYDQAEAIADRNLAPSLSNDPDQEGIYKYRDGEVATIRVGIVQAAAKYSDAASLGLLQRALKDATPQVPDGRLLHASAVALASRPDFTDLKQVSAARSALHPSMQASVDVALAGR